MTLARVAALLTSGALVCAIVGVPLAAGSAAHTVASAAKKKGKKKCKHLHGKKKKACKRKRNRPAHAAAVTPAILTISPASVDYGQVPLNPTSSPTQQFDVRNIGGQQSAILTAGVNGANANQFPAQNDNCSGLTLDPFHGCTIQVQFTPTGTGPMSAVLIVIAGGTGASAALTGNGLSPTSLAITPPSHAFGTVVANSTHPPVANPAFPAPTSFAFTVMNTGLLPTGFLSASFTGTDPGQFTVTNNACIIVLGGSSCTVSVAFTPTTATPSAKSAVLNVSDGLGNSASALVSGTATGLTISPTSFNFGTTASGSPVTQTFTVTNGSAVTSGILGPPAYGGTNPGDYSTGLNGCSSLPLLSGGFCTFQVVFNPANFGGVRASSATVSISAQPGGSAFAALTGMKSP